MRTEAAILVRDAIAPPRLSVVTPFHRDDPSPLLESLASTPSQVEFILLDDGSGDAALLSRAVGACARLGGAARIIVWSENRGRAAARNRLTEEARSAYVLFLDADMKADQPDFIARWLRLIETKRPTVAFGGLSLRHTKRTPATALHFNLFARSDCREARDRARSPAQFVSGANLLVRRDFLATLPFDAEFVGWGFEDVDWALRASAAAPILHVDNTVSHLGLDDDKTLLRKSVQAGPNFARLAAKHAQAVSRFTAYKAARALRLTPARPLLLRVLAWLSQLRMTPMPMRRLALKLFRATHCAEHLP